MIFHQARISRKVETTLRCIYKKATAFSHPVGRATPL